MWNREGLSHRDLAIIVSFGVAARCSLTAPSVSEGKLGNSAAGIDSWQRVVTRYSYHLHDSKHLARSPGRTGILACLLKGPGGGDFFMFDGSRGRSVSIQIDENLALLVVFWAITAQASARGLFETPCRPKTRSKGCGSIRRFSARPEGGAENREICRFPNQLTPSLSTKRPGKNREFPGFGKGLYS
jgi:hypothetical protein